MFENFYTTKMSMGKKCIKERFEKMRRKTGRKERIISFISAFALLAAAVCATAFAAGINEISKEKANLEINGEKSYISIVHLKNKKYLNTDSYYVPLREMAEKLGAEVKYDVDRSDVARVYSDSASKNTFPYFAYQGLEELAADDVMLWIYGGSTGTLKNEPVIEIAFKNGKRFNCQPGCEMYSEIGGEYLSSWAPPVVIMEDKAYIPLRAVANIIGGNESVKWDDAAHDTYFDGALKFDKENKNIIINY